MTGENKHVKDHVNSSDNPVEKIIKLKINFKKTNEAEL